MEPEIASAAKLGLLGITGGLCEDYWRITGELLGAYWGITGEDKVDNWHIEDIRCNT